MTCAIVIWNEIQAVSDSADTFRLLSDPGMVMALVTRVIAAKRRGFELDEQTVSDGLPMLAWISTKLLEIEADLGWEDRPTEPTVTSRRGPGRETVLPRED